MKKKTKKKSKLTVISLKLSPLDLKTLQAFAKKFAKGNVSCWLRYTGQRYIPKKGEVIPQDPYLNRTRR